MKKIIAGIQFLDRHKGTALFLGALVSTTAGATWWLAKGGAAAFITSITALSDPQIAEALKTLPERHRIETEERARIVEALEELNAGQRQITDALDAFRTNNEAVVEWARDHSQLLTDGAGGCYAGEDCTVYFRGRRTQAGAACKLEAARPRLALPDGREFPVAFQNDLSELDLTTNFQTVEAKFMVPAFIEPGIVGVIVWTIYADCPFAPEGQRIERETFRLLVEIEPRP